MKKLLAIILVLAMVFTLCACGSKKNEPSNAEPEKFVFTMGIDPEYPPFSYLGDDGEYTGFDVDVCRACCEILGWDLEIFGVNWDEKLIQLDADECDCVWAGMTILPSMKEAGYVLSNPYFYSTQVFLVKEDSGINSAADMAGKVAAVMLGTSGDTLLNEDLSDLKDSFKDLVTCESFLKCFAELGGDAVDGVFVDLPVAEAFIAENAGYKIINENLGAEEYGIAFRSGDQALCDAIEGAVQQLVDNGTYAELAAKYPEIVENLTYLK